MFYFALKDIKEGTIGKMQSELGDPNRISTRGEKIDEVKVPSELSGGVFPVNLLANKYCPTNRDFFLKVVKRISQPLTWPSYQGRIIHKLCFKMFQSVESYVLRENIIQKANLLKYVQQKGQRFIRELTSDIDRKISGMPKKPSKTMKDNFLTNLSKLVRMESETVSTFIDYTIATNFDVEVASEFRRLFPFQREISLNATPLGFSLGVKPDFIYSRGGSIVIGDIKTGEIRDFHKLVLASYALAYEYHERVPVNFGTILNINLSNERNVPIYKCTETVVISDKYRQAFLKLRDEKFNIAVSREDPGPSPNKDVCTECPYISHCGGT